MNREILQLKYVGMPCYRLTESSTIFDCDSRIAESYSFGIKSLNSRRECFRPHGETFRTPEVLYIPIVAQNI